MLYYLNHSPIDAYFSKNSSDFVVREIPLYEFSGSGEHLIVHIQKKDLTTAEALKIISTHTGIKARDIGYAGLKDRAGLTTQYISLPKSYEKSLESFSGEKLKILSTTYHNNKLKVGHLKGNNFFIRLKKVMPSDALKLTEVLKTIDTQGFANYFGYQRFGKFYNNQDEGKEILSGAKTIKNKKLSKFLISAYQSEFFNSWLSKRVEISKFADEFSEQELAKIYSIDPKTAQSIKSQKQFFKLLKGEILGHYPFGKCFVCENLDAEIERFNKRDITSMGLIIGKKAMLASGGFAKKLEDEIYSNAMDFQAQMTGTRRFAWCYLQDLVYRYDEQNAWFNISFFLPKGSYATVVLEEILHKNILI